MMTNGEHDGQSSIDPLVVIDSARGPIVDACAIPSTRMTAYHGDYFIHSIMIRTAACPLCDEKHEHQLTWVAKSEVWSRIPKHLINTPLPVRRNCSNYTPGFGPATYLIRLAETDPNAIAFNGTLSIGELNELISACHEKLLRDTGTEALLNLTIRLVQAYDTRPI